MQAIKSEMRYMVNHTWLLTLVHIKYMLQVLKMKMEMKQSTYTD